MREKRGVGPEPIEQTVPHIKLMEANPNPQGIEMGGLEEARNG